MKKLPLLVAALLAICSFQSCKKTEIVTPAPAHQAQIMFVNGCSGTTQLAASFSGKALTDDGAKSIGYMGNSGYQYVALDSLYPAVPVTFIKSGASFVTTSFPCLENVHYSAFAGGTSTTPTITFTPDIFDGMGSGNAKLRFVNLAGNVNNLTFELGNENLFTGINSAVSTPFTEVSAGEKNFKVYDPNNLNATQVLFALRKLEAGKYYTVLYSGTANGSGNAILQLSLYNNQ